MVSARMPSPQEVWERVLGLLQVEVARGTYEAFLRETVGLAWEGGRFLVGTPSPFARAYLEQRAYGLVREALERIVGQAVEVEFRVVAKGTGEVVSPPTPAPPPPPPSAETEASGECLGMPLNPRYTFAAFIVGECNRYAHAAAVAAAEHPGRKYNPIFIYSDVGLGKTHLLHAIGHRCLERGMRVLYTSAEQFTSEFIRSIREGTAEAFRLRFRNGGILLMDDVHFLIGKEQTQEAFFHIFNELHNAGKQIVLTCDRPPKALRPLEDRLRSRFEWGLVADIQPPELETRLAILRAKADALGMAVPAPVLTFLGKRIYRSIRELEGVLNRLKALAEVTGRPITLELAQQALDLPGTGPERRPLDPEEVVSVVAQHFGLEPMALKGPRRDKVTATARHIAMFLLREEAQRPLTEIGRLLGGKDHTTVLHACEKVRLQMDTDPQVRHALLVVRERLQRMATSSGEGR
ncbi:MAG: chromosomal replication initiator protein DnaA [Dehalococcoidia bacterium]|nr:chromosomal replication initiator protein DnaA [Dehalococcoidia bacterium]MDW8120219.1 chromosomal replication initiator protein DnaA [Chloroflexota bacterium]